MMNRVAEKVREMFPNVNKLISNLKKVFLIAPYHVQVYKEILPNMPLLAPEPVLIGGELGWKPLYLIAIILRV
jgi:hypothetical protein